MTEQTYQQLTVFQQQLVDSAEQVMAQALNPGSGFVVGSAVLASSGKVYSGANVKLSATGLVACAELSAFLQALSAGERSFQAIAVIAKHGTKNLVEPNYPCGRCAQTIHELNVVGKSDMIMLYSNTEKDRIAVGVNQDFLPHPFASGLVRHDA